MAPSSSPRERPSKPLSPSPIISIINHLLSPPLHSSSTPPPTEEPPSPPYPLPPLTKINLRASFFSNPHPTLTPHFVAVNEGGWWQLDDSGNNLRLRLKLTTPFPLLFRYCFSLDFFKLANLDNWK